MGRSLIVGSIGFVIGYLIGYLLTAWAYRDSLAAQLRQDEAPAARRVRRRAFMDMMALLYPPGERDRSVPCSHGCTAEYFASIGEALHDDGTECDDPTPPGAGAPTPEEG